MSLSPIAEPVVQLNPSSTLHASPENIALFHALMAGAQQGSKGHTPALPTKEGQAQEWTAQSLLHDSALRVHRAETSLQKVQNDLQASVSQLKESGGSVMPAAMVNMQFLSTYYFVGVNRASSGAQDFSDELSGLTKGR